MIYIKVPGGTKELSWPAYNERVHPPTGIYRVAQKHESKKTTF